MKLKFTYTLLTSFFMAFLFMSNSGGRAGSANWGNTGAPGDQLEGTEPRTCMNCHNTGGPFDISLDIEILNNDGEAVTTYIPNELYTCRVTVNSMPNPGEPAGFGFQIVGLFDSDDSDVDLFSAPDDNVQIELAGNTGRRYAEHDGVSTSNQFNVMWTGPPAGSGPVTFYSCGNGVNENGSTSGDAAACNTLNLVEDMSVATNEFADENSLSIFPNPVNNLLNIESKLPVSGDYIVKIYNQVGQLMVAENKVIQQDEIFQVDMSPYATGVYSILLEHDEIKVTKRFLKQ